MKKIILLTAILLITFFSLILSPVYAAKKGHKERALAISRCDTELDRCKDEAVHDRKMCKRGGADRTGKSGGPNCDEDYIDDRKECAGNYVSCVSRVRINASQIMHKYQPAAPLKRQLE